MSNNKTKPADVAVDSLLNALDELESSGQVLSWVRDWVLTDPQNPVTGSKYHGFNTLRCALHNALGGYSENLFITRKGAVSAGGRIKDDEYARSLVLVRPNIIKVTDDDGTVRDQCIGWIYFRCWNIEQTEGVDRSKLKVQKSVAKGAKRKRNAEKTLARVGADIRYGGGVACYYPAKDYINVPKPEDFDSTEGFYATTFHEVVHWTGHESRLNRFKSGEYGKEAYAKEELVAEFGAFALCAVHGIKADEHNALAYIQGWKKRIRENPAGAVVTSVSSAQKAVRMILGVKG